MERENNTETGHVSVPEMETMTMPQLVKKVTK